jgi:hypothetical protein
MDPGIIMGKLQGPVSQGNGGGHEPCQFNERSITTKTCRYSTLRRLNRLLPAGGQRNLQQPRENANKSTFVVDKFYKAKAYKYCPSHHLVS